MNPPAAPTNRRRWIAAACLAALALYWPLAFVATHVPMRDLPSSTLPLDKVFHFCSFAILGGLLTSGLALRNGWQWTWALWAVAIAAVYGIVDELTQIPVGRTADPLDWLADVMGATMGACAAGLLCEIVRRRRG
jgi:VanZ family protein